MASSQGPSTTGIGLGSDNLPSTKPGSDISKSITVNHICDFLEDRKEGILTQRRPLKTPVPTFLKFSRCGNISSKTLSDLIKGKQPSAVHA